MNSHERILAAINHKEPDRVPVDLGATPSSGISGIAYANLKSHLNMVDGHTRIYDVVQQLAQPEDPFIDLFGIDVLDVGRMFNERDDDWYDVRLAEDSIAQYPAWFKPQLQKDGAQEVEINGEVIARMPSGGTFFDQTIFPYLDGYPDNYDDLPIAMQQVLWAALAHSPWDHANEPDFWQQLRERTIKLRENTECALMINCGCNLFEWGTFLRQMDRFLMDLLREQANVEALLDALMEIHLDTLEKVCKAVGDVVDILRFGDDLGMNNGPFMSPGTYQTLFKCRHAKLNDYVHKNSKMKTFLHSCGSIFALLPDLIEAGYDVINPVQTNCRNMDPIMLKRDYGQDITFWGGGCDTTSVLNMATPQEVKKHVLKRMEILSPGGGFVFNTVHNILPEVPAENIVAMFDAVREFNSI